MDTDIRINEQLIRDPRFPVHRIADKLIPYVKMLAQTFRPERIILFGSYAYGQPDEDSDVDLLIVKTMNDTPIKEATAMRRALRPIRHAGANLPLDLLVRDPDDLKRRIASGAFFHTEIVENGIALYELKSA